MITSFSGNNTPMKMIYFMLTSSPIAILILIKNLFKENPMKSKTTPLLMALIVLALVLTACSGKSPAGANPALPDAEGGGSGEAARGPSLTNPGGLPAAPASGDSANSQSGEERMVKTEDPAGLFSILFVDKWTQESGSTPGSLRSSQSDGYAEVEVISAQGQTPMQAAQALDASQANGAAGYQKLVIQDGTVNGLVAASLIYQYEAGTNTVTGNALKFIASQIFIGGGPADKLGHVTFAAPYAYYGDLSGIFDNILAGFAWK
jgi:hypothetical protein